MQPYLHKVQYYETDQMGIVHHSNFIRWMEEARVDWMERIGLPFTAIEQRQLYSPVLSVDCKYCSMCKFGQTVAVAIALTWFRGARFAVSYRMTDAATGELYAQADSTHCFVDAQGRVVLLKKAAPEWYRLFCSHLEQPQ